MCIRDSPDGDGFTTSLENQTDSLDPNTVNSISDLTSDSESGGSNPTLPGDSSGTSPVVNGWFYTSDMGWLFTNSTTYPYLYRKDTSSDGGVWLYFDTTSTNELRFYNFETSLWETY